LVQTQCPERPERPEEREDRDPELFEERDFDELLLERDRPLSDWFRSDRLLSERLLRLPVDWLAA
jgi:hypothetical protein